MRKVVTTDKSGYKRLFLVRDSDSDEMAEQGIPVGPPNLDELDWTAIKKEINNRFADEGIFTWKDVEKSSVGLGIVCAVVKRYVAAAYKQMGKSGELSRIIYNDNGRRAKVR